MAALCFYFQVHQPYRLRRYSVFDSTAHYFDDALNAALLARVAERCYLPMNALLLELCRRYPGQARFAMSLTGTVIEQMQAHAPRALESFQRLVSEGCVELLGETANHSLASLFSRKEFDEQVALHGATIERLFGVTPRVFRNTELIFDNNVAAWAARLGFAGILAEGWPPLVGTHRVGQMFSAARGKIKVLLRHYGLSDDIAFRFSDRSWDRFPLKADAFADSLANSGEACCNLFMDYETFGEHQPRETGIFEFMAALPQFTLERGVTWKQPHELLERRTVAALDVPDAVSWADTERDVSAWLGNAMQTTSMEALWSLEAAVKKKGDAALLRDWRRMTSSDHPYYMSTKWLADGAVHQHFSPYESPYDAYINFNNVLDNLRTRVKGKPGAG